MLVIISCDSWWLNILAWRDDHVMNPMAWLVGWMVSLAHGGAAGGTTMAMEQFIDAPIFEPQIDHMNKSKRNWWKCWHHGGLKSSLFTRLLGSEPLQDSLGCCISDIDSCVMLCSPYRFVQWMWPCGLYAYPSESTWQPAIAVASRVSWRTAGRAQKFTGERAPPTMETQLKVTLQSKWFPWLCCRRLRVPFQTYTTKYVDT